MNNSVASFSLSSPLDGRLIWMYNPLKESVTTLIYQEHPKYLEVVQQWFLLHEAEFLEQSTLFCKYDFHDQSNCIPLNQDAELKLEIQT